jgi:hypothetical protein
MKGWIGVLLAIKCTLGRNNICMTTRLMVYEILILSQQTLLHHNAKQATKL